MNDAKTFFDEFTKFAPQYTPIMTPLAVGLILFSVLCLSGYKYTQIEIDKKYNKESPNREPELVARLVLVLIMTTFLSLFVADITYTIIDWSQNKKWYVWKYKWFPGMLS